MLRRLTILAALTVATGAALTAPAHAAGHTICVGSPVGTCDEHADSIQDAIALAVNNLTPDVILVGPGTYSDGPYDLDGSPHTVTLRGSGQGVTTITGPPSSFVTTYVVAHQAGVENLTIDIPGTLSSGDTGLFLSESTADQVSVTSAGTANLLGIDGRDGSVVTRSSVQLSHGAGNTGVLGHGGLSVSDTEITAANGFKHSKPGTIDRLSRVQISADVLGISTDSGDVDVDDSLIDLGTAPGAKGIAVENTNNSTYSKTLTANHVTVVGGGAGSYGVYAYAARATTLQQATVILGNSIVRGPATDLYAVAGNDGAQGGTSTAAIATLYSDWHTQSAVSQPNGTASIVNGAGHLDVDPGFRDPANGNYRLAAGSPLVDMGMPGTSGLTLDLDGSARLQDGNGDGIAVRDMGAYEAPAKATGPGNAGPDTTAPDTTIAAHPRKHTTKHRATFGFTSNESHVTFQCRLDKKAWGSCTPPSSYRVTRGWHVFKVRARDAAGNLDATPASWRFKRN